MASMLQPAVRHGPIAGWRWPILAAALAIVALALGWVGYAASDDAAYYLAAQHWLVAPPFAGHDHWATRFPLVVTLALAMRVLGEGAPALTTVALLWYAMFGFVANRLATRIGGARTGWIATLLLVTMPVVIANATTASCDLVEASFLMLGLLWIGDAAATPTLRWKPVWAGLAFGMAILCRETTALALLGFVPLFLLGRPVPRRTLIVMAIACAAVLAGEAAFQWAATGHPLNRWDVAFHHDSHIDRAANLEGNVLLFAPIDPLLVLLINDDFALLFWFALAALALRADRLLDAAGRKRLAIVAMLALATFLLVGALYTKLVLNPRYFMLPAIAAAILVAVWLDRARIRLRTSVLSVAIAANLLMLGVENTHPRWAAEALILAGKAHPGETVLTDAATYHRALMPIGWAGLGQVAQGAARPGGLYLSADGAIPAGAVCVARYPSPRTPLGVVLDDLGIIKFAPMGVRRRLIAPNPEAVLVRPPDERGPRSRPTPSITALPSVPAPA